MQEQEVQAQVQEQVVQAQAQEVQEQVRSSGSVEVPEQQPKARQHTRRNPLMQRILPLEAEEPTGP